jgi:hypothetical protein
MIPDLLGFWLTGERDRFGTWNATLIDKLSLPRSLFPVLGRSGSRVGSLGDDVAAEVGAALDGSRSDHTTRPRAVVAAVLRPILLPHNRSWSTLPVGLTSLTGWHVCRLRNRPVLPENWRLQQNSHALTGARPWSCAADSPFLSRGLL